MDYILIFAQTAGRLVTAMLLGGIIGLEREYRLKDAGFRTHFLVALGAALFTIVSQDGFTDGVKDSSRVAAQVVSGIGFLGAGLIVFQKNVVRGLTTAAGLWVTAAIGMACGVGMYATAVVTAVLILIGLEVINHYIPQMGATHLLVSFSAPSHESARRVMEQIKQHSVEVSHFELRTYHTPQGQNYKVKMEIKVLSGDHNRRILNDLSEFEDFTLVSTE